MTSLNNLGVPLEVIEKPWGHEEILVKDRYIIKRLCISPNQMLSLQYHKHKLETMLVESGDGTVYYEDKLYALNTGDFVHIKPLTIHSIIACEIGMTIIEISTPELTDIVRLKDIYGRV